MNTRHLLALAASAGATATCLARPTAASLNLASEQAQPAGAGESAPAKADPAPSTQESSSDWRFEFTTWIWLVGMTGDVGVRGRAADVDANFGDILEASDSIFAFSGRLEVGKGRWGAFVDGMYSDLGAEDQSGPVGFTDIDVTMETILIDFGATYRLGEWKPTGNAAGNSRPTSLDLYAGARYTDLDVELDPRVLATRSKSVSWFDPIVGAKLVLPLSEGWHFALNGDVGGFGAGSDFTWSATGVFGYDFHIGQSRACVFAGYRAIGQDYSEGSGNEEFTWDVVQHGPLIGLSLRF
ncbi:MAG: hypothetical protein J0L61_03600 [Planctomycetes bacterium]|nr:hypothetical protein [Planctomycetota bacterium]